MNPKANATMGNAARVEELARLLDRLIERHEALYGVISDKLDAMRRACVPDMLDAASREGATADEILALDQQRSAMAAELGRAMQLPAAATTSIRAMAPRLSAPQATRLMKSAEVLREKMLAVARANRVVELVCQEMLRHVRAVFADLIQPETSNPTYSQGGAVDRPSGPQVINAVV